MWAPTKVPWIFLCSYAQKKNSPNTHETPVVKPHFLPACRTAVFWNCHSRQRALLLFGKVSFSCQFYCPLALTIFKLTAATYHYMLCVMHCLGASNLLCPERYRCMTSRDYGLKDRKENDLRFKPESVFFVVNPHPLRHEQTPNSSS